MKIDLDAFRVTPGEAPRLSDRPTRIQAPYDDKAGYKAELKSRVKAIAKLQQALYAAKSEALLLVLQALDAAGKDGTIRHVFSGVNPQGCQVTSFKQPSETELAHDFLWRATRALPPRGFIGVFNRSYYEEALVVRVHPDLLPAEGAPETETKRFWRHRFEAITDYERHLSRSGVHVLKVFLHLSKDEQKRRFLSRMDDPDKTWKLSPSDMAERERWDDYAKAYESCIGATGGAHAPWYVVPADDKRTARLIVADLVHHTLKAADPRFPDPSAAITDHLGAYRERLEAGG